MKPILFEGSATAFSTNGIGALADCIACEVTEKSGIFELQMVYPVTGVHYSDLKPLNRIVVKPNEKQTRQAFEIYEITKPIDGKVTVNAHHITYAQSYVPVRPFIATGISQTIQGFGTNALESNLFTFTTDLTNETSTFNLRTPTSLRQCLGGMEGSVSDVFSGSSGVEFLWDNYNTFITLHRGEDNGVTLRYRKNITNLEQTETTLDMVTGVLPMWTNTDDSVSFYGDIQYTANANDYPYKRTIILDLSSEFDSTPTVQQLNEAGQRYVSRATVGIPSTNIKVSFVDLTKASPFENINVLEKVNLYDTIHVIYTPLGIKYDAKVIETRYDVLRERYNSVEIGTPKNNIAQTIADNLGDISSLKLTNNKLVSVTQTLDREVGEVQTTVASVEQRVDTTESNVSQMTINLEGIQTQVTNTQTDLADSVAQLSSTIEQTAKDITLTITDVQDTLSEQGNQITTLETYIKATSRGLEIGQNTNNVVAVLEPNELAFYDRSDTKLAWLNTDDGLGASALSIGDANTQANRWRIFTRSNGSHLTFTRHS